MLALTKRPGQLFLILVLRQPFYNLLSRQRFLFIWSLHTGAQQPHINKGTVENTYIAIPHKNIMDEYI